MAKLKLGVDVGGTFTDVVGINEDGKRNCKCADSGSG